MVVADVVRTAVGRAEGVLTAVADGGGVVGCETGGEVVAPDGAIFAAEGALGPWGLFESIDYTPARLGDTRARGVVVKTYMAHHQAMSLVALDNCLHGNPMQRRFHAEPRVQAAELLLQERSPHLVPLDKPPEEHNVEETSGRSLPVMVRRYVTPHTLTPRGHLLSNGSYSVMVTNSGGGYSRWRDLAVTRWRESS